MQWKFNSLTKFLLPPIKWQFSCYNPVKSSFSAVAIALVPFSVSCSLYTKVRTILILINVWYLQNVNFSLEKSSNGQNHSSSGSHHPIKNLPSSISYPPPLNAIWKNLVPLNFFCLSPPGVASHLSWSPPLLELFLFIFANCFNNIRVKQ